MKKVLIIAPHPDDEILGCGGSIIKHIQAGDEVYICIVTKGVQPLFDPQIVEKTRVEALTCHNHIGVKKTYFLDFPSVLIDKEDRYIINGKVLDVIKVIKPDDVYIPHWGDMQKDHQIVADACMVALRPKYGHKVRHIYGYETLSETAWNAPNVQNEFIPNVFVDISDTLDKKIEALGFFKTQLSPFPDARSLEAVEALARYRGSIMHMRAAEAFMLIREIK
jgi:LmbE family N-acetylglucosaminyl deacetylase